MRGPGRFPLGLRRSRREEDLPPGEAAVTKHVPDLKIPRDTQGRHRLHPQVAPGLLQDPECGARHEPWRTPSARAGELSDAASRHPGPVGVGVFDAWDLAADVGEGWAPRRQDWISLLNKNRLRQTARLPLRDANGWALKRPVPPIAVEPRLPWIPAQAYRPVTMRAHP